MNFQNQQMHSYSCDELYLFFDVLCDFYKWEKMFWKLP